MAIEQLANQDAIRHLDELAADAPGEGRLSLRGPPSGIDALIPGVTTKVLGPPTIDQWPAVAGQRGDDPEYWLRQHGLLANMLRTVDAPPAVIRVAGASSTRPTIDPGPLRWIVERMRDQQTHSLLRIVSSLEDALNNTSIILQFRSGTRRLLFPGDAQIENWSYCPHVDLADGQGPAGRPRHDRPLQGRAPRQPQCQPAQPRHALASQTRPFVSMMSTLPDVHGETEATAVPRPRS